MSILDTLRQTAILNGTDPDEDETIKLLSGLRDGTWLDAQEFPPLRWHLPGIIPEGSNLLVGPPKVGKSWFVLALALAVASGGRMLGETVESRPVLYLALEDGDRRLQDRCRTLLEGEAIPEGFTYLTRIEPGSVLATIDAWLDCHPDTSPLVILDTLGKVMPPALMGESSYGRDYRVGSALKRLVDHHPGSALLVNHHDRKAQSEDFVERVSGTNGLAGAADTIIVLARDRHADEGTIAVTGRDVGEGEYAVRFDGTTGTWSTQGRTLADAAARAAQQRAASGIGDRSAEIVTYVAEHPDGVRAREVATTFEMGDKAAGTYLGRLADAGRIQRASRGLYTPVGSVELLETKVLDFPQLNTSNTPTGGPDAS
ncbi:MAG: AAA family ATPase [Acidimicrobiales bacterium]|nr:AAA family ATPase [Acidimicrobiales bacterium]